MGGISSSIPANRWASSMHCSKSVVAFITNLAPSGEPPPCIQPGIPAPTVSHSTNLAALVRASAEVRAFKYF